MTFLFDCHCFCSRMCKFGCNNASQHAKLMHRDAVCKLNSLMSCISRMHNYYSIFNIRWACPYFHDTNNATNISIIFQTRIRLPKHDLPYGDQSLFLYNLLYLILIINKLILIKHILLTFFQQQWYLNICFMFHLLVYHKRGLAWCGMVIGGIWSIFMNDRYNRWRSV